MQRSASSRAEDEDTFFIAGHTAPAGVYRQLGSGQDVRISEEDVLPATCDGTVAVYVRQPMTWEERNAEERLQPDFKASP